MGPSRSPDGREAVPTVCIPVSFLEGVGLAAAYGEDLAGDVGRVVGG